MEKNERRSRWDISSSWNFSSCFLEEKNFSYLLTCVRSLNFPCSYPSTEELTKKKKNPLGTHTLLRRHPPWRVYTSICRVLHTSKHGRVCQERVATQSCPRAGSQWRPTSRKVYSQGWRRWSPRCSTGPDSGCRYCFALIFLNQHRRAPETSISSKLMGLLPGII